MSGPDGSPASRHEWPGWVTGQSPSARRCQPAGNPPDPGLAVSHGPGAWVPGRGGGRVDGIMSGQAQATAGGAVHVAADAGGGLIIADDLPDGLVIADHAGCVTVFNRAAGRLTGIPPAHAVGRDVRHILPLQDADGRNWW